MSVQNLPISYRQQLQTALDQDNRNLYIQTLSSALMNNTAPMGLRKLREAQHSHEKPDGESIKVKLFVSSTVGGAFTLAARFVRIGVRAGLLPVSSLYSLGKGARYGIEGEPQENFKRTVEELVDLRVAVEAFVIGWFNLPRIGSGSERIKKWTDYYVQRIDERNERDRFVESKISEYQERLAQTKEAWRNGNPPPDFSGEAEGEGSDS